MIEWPKKVTLSEDDITLGDLEDFEEACGADMLEVLRSEDKSIRQLRWLLFIAMRRDNPALTVDDLRDMPVSVLVEMELSGGDAGNPPDGGD